MIESTVSYKPTLEADAIKNALGCLLVEGSISDRDLEGRLKRLSRLFADYVSTCPAPCWSHGLAISDEVCRVTEIYLPYADIRDAFLRLARLSLHGNHPLPPILGKADSWIDFLHRVPAEHAIVNPSEFIARLARDDAARIRFLFSIYLQEQYGGGFGRYPSQYAFLQHWLADNIPLLPLPVSCLDAACGSGEGSYELACALLKSGVTASEIRITGVTVSPLEIFAAAHACFPHAPQRELEYRGVVKLISEAGAHSGISFVAADLRDWDLPGCYHVIICNGILGGPYLHKLKEVECLVARLAKSLCRGGIILAADRFHAGWKKLLTARDMENILAGCGLEVLPVGEGVAGMRH